ncbi:hypothetical protein V6N12_058869 [Hibiscus sabdariffa]|uniref:Uncharacterized protein n=1 Tax=Hibiscus sabdariffa TaxID=183260 RepID=A0ABR2ETF4_9ROSI
MLGWTYVADQELFFSLNKTLGFHRNKKTKTKSPPFLPSLPSAARTKNNKSWCWPLLFFRVLLELLVAESELVAS